MTAVVLRYARSLLCVVEFKYIYHRYYLDPSRFGRSVFGFSFSFVNRALWALSLLFGQRRVFGCLIRISISLVLFAMLVGKSTVSYACKIVLIMRCYVLS